MSSTVRSIADRLETADTAVERIVEEGSSSSIVDDHGDHAAHEHRLDPRPLAAVGEPEHVRRARSPR